MWRVIVFVDQALVEGYRIFISPYLCLEAVVVLVEALLLIRLVGIQPSIVPTCIRDVLLFRLVLKEAVHVFSSLRLRVARGEEVWLREECARLHNGIPEVRHKVLLYFRLVRAREVIHYKRPEGAT